jgi:hypothetical protein
MESINAAAPAETPACGITAEAPMARTKAEDVAPIIAACVELHGGDSQNRIDAQDA